MHRRQFTNDERVSGWTYGFEELWLNTRRILWHPGDTRFFSTGLYLIPDHDVGLFVSYNHRAGSQARTDLIQAFMDHYFPIVYWPTPPAVGEFAKRGADFSGHYISTRSNVTPVEKLLTLFKQIKVSPTSNGVLRISGLSNIGVSRWIETESDVFRKLSSQEFIVFRRNQQGRVTHLFENNFPEEAYFKLPWYAVNSIHFTALAICSLIFVTEVLQWTSVTLWRRRQRSSRSRSQIWAVRVSGSISMLNLLFIIALVIILTNIPSLVPALETVFKLVLTLPLIGAMLTVATLIITVFVWRYRHWSNWGRLHYTLVSISGLSFLLLLNFWNLLGFRI